MEIAILDAAKLYAESRPAGCYMRLRPVGRGEQLVLDKNYVTFRTQDLCVEIAWHIRESKVDSLIVSGMLQYWRYKFVSGLPENLPGTFGYVPKFPMVEMTRDETHIMVYARDYESILKRRRACCLEACVVLLRILPIKQKDLRRWFVKELVWTTRRQQEWFSSNDSVT